jgi:hypothetical protein
MAGGHINGENALERTMSGPPINSGRIASIAAAEAALAWYTHRGGETTHRPLAPSGVDVDRRAEGFRPQPES